jgi:hypothetical protein
MEKADLQYMMDDEFVLESSNFPKPVVCLASSKGVCRCVSGGPSRDLVSVVCGGPAWIQSSFVCVYVLQVGSF